MKPVILVFRSHRGWGVASLRLSKLGGLLGKRGHLVRPKAREGVTPDPITENFAMRSERSEGLREATRALTLAVAGLTFMLISDLVLLILY
jgi:hypothetical protein